MTKQIFWMIVCKVHNVFRIIKCKLEYYLSPYPNRPMMKLVKDNIKNSMVGVEIGVYKGGNACNMLLHLPIKMLYLIDPYIDSDDIYDSAKKKVRSFKNKVKLIRKLSENATNDVPNEVDFVYIDGDHSYEYVKRDIEMYYPKVKVGGIIGGHNFELLFPGIIKAVLEFTDKHNLEVSGRRVDWWIIKKEKIMERCFVCKNQVNKRERLYYAGRLVHKKCLNMTKIFRYKPIRRKKEKKNDRR